MIGKIILSIKRYQPLVGIFFLLFSWLSFGNHCQHVNDINSMSKQYFDKNGTFCIEVFFKQGQIIKGTFDSLDQLDLVTKQNQHWRRLSDGGDSFIFTVPKDDNYRLIATGLPNQSFNIDWKVIPQGTPKPYTLISSELIELEHQLSIDKNAEDRFWKKIEQTGTPLIEPYDEKNVIMTFLWRGELENIKILGSPTGDHDSLYRLKNSDIWFRSYIVPKTTRYSYQLAPNIPVIDRPFYEQRRAILATAQQDPLNPNVFPVDGVDKFHRSSYVILPDAPVQFGIELEANSPKGKLTQHLFSSQYLNNQRDITIYWPAQINEIDKSKLNLVILFDSKQYQQKTPIITIMDNLIAHKRINPTIVVMIDTLDSNTRTQELPPNSTNMADSFAKELLPWLKEQDINVLPQNTVIAGSSFGGLASSYIAFNYPELFPNVLSLSGSYWWAPNGHEDEWLSWQFALAPTKSIRFYLNAGLFEGDLLIANRHFRNILQARGYQYNYHESASGHDYFHWQGELAEGLQYLLK